MAKRDVVIDRIPEWRLQAEICASLEARIANGDPFLFAGSLEGVKLNPRVAQMAKATGMKAGEPDIRLYFANGRTVFVELKCADGKLGPDQKERIPILRGLGFTVHVVFAGSCESAVLHLRQIVDAEIQSPGSSALLFSATYFPKVRAK